LPVAVRLGYGIKAFSRRRTQLPYSPRRSRATPEKTLGEYIRDRRIELKTGLRSLAKVVDITPSYLSDIEYGRRMPSEGVLRRIAIQLTLEFDELMARSGRAGEEAERHLKRNPEPGVLFRCITKHGLRGEDIDKLIKGANRPGRKGGRL
jgi:transcriptional regulator with XRE-family HTH domain